MASCEHKSHDTVTRGVFMGVNIEGAGVLTPPTE